MLHVVTIIFSAFAISALGSLPLGVLNVMALRIAADRSVKQGLIFSVGVALVEIVYILLTACMVHLISQNSAVIKQLQWVMVVVLVAMAIASFRARATTAVRPDTREYQTSAFLLGVSLSAVNPIQFVFWSGWLLQLLVNEVIKNQNADFIVFAISAGVGTFAVLALFACLGWSLADRLRKNNRTVQLITGLIYCLLAIYQIYHLL